MLNQIEADLLVPRLMARWGEGGPALAFPPGEPVPALAIRGLVGGGFEMSIVAYLRALTRLGPKYVAVTDGARGAFVGSRKEIIFTPARESKIVGTAGAGDAFGATLTAYLALGYRIDLAVSAAAANSASGVGARRHPNGLTATSRTGSKGSDNEALKDGPCVRYQRILASSLIPAFDTIRTCKVAPTIINFERRKGRGSAAASQFD